MKVEKINSEPFIRINLTMDEAEMLRDVCSCPHQVASFIRETRISCHNPVKDTSEYADFLVKLWDNIRIRL
jgi:hypothetical protein